MDLLSKSGMCQFDSDILSQPSRETSRAVNPSPMRWGTGKTEKEDKTQKTEEEEGCTLSHPCICAVTSLAKPV